MGFGARLVCAALVAFGLVLAVGSMPAFAQVGGHDGAQGGAQALLRQGINHRQQGNLNLAIETLARALEHTLDPRLKSRITSELGVAYYEAHRFDDAAPLLEAAYREAADAAERRRHAIDLGNLWAARRQPQDAARYYEEARAAGADDPAASVSAGLNLARLAPEGERLAKLATLAGEISAVSDARERARLHLNLGQQATTLRAPALRLAYEQLAQARSLTEHKPDRLSVQALDALAQLYEDNGRDAEALELTDAAVATLQSGDAPDLRFTLEWRRGRVLWRLGQGGQALGAYERAVDHLEAIRQDIPIEYTDGRSSFRETLEPVYLGLADLLLLQADAAPPDERDSLVRRARDAVELIKQTELEDFLGDRCTTEAARSAKSTIPAGAAVLYPVILPDRLELLVETADRMLRRAVRVTSDEVRRSSLALAIALRNSRPFMAESQRLHRWLLEPVEALLDEHRIDTVVVVPDGVLRLLPFASLHDGSRFMAERYAFAVAPALTLTHVSPPGARERATLLAGLSEPGPVVDKLPSDIADAILTSAPEPGGEASGRGVATRSVDAFKAPGTARGARGVAAPGPGVLRSAQETRRLRQRLALPAVKVEIETLEQLTRNRTLLDQDFTLAALRRSVATQSHGIVHIASHGFFGGSADTSFIMTFDDLLTMDGLQALLRTGASQKPPIELLTLSACETAEGDDRSPLGMSGAALRARAGSVLGTLWPVADEAAMRVMSAFYQSLASSDRPTKIQALQKAQRQLIDSKDMNHPFYWAPFILIPNWL
jgi:CHAT domain-containing protein